MHEGHSSTGKVLDEMPEQAVGPIIQNRDVQCGEDESVGQRSKD